MKNSETPDVPAIETAPFQASKGAPMLVQLRRIVLIAGLSMAGIGAATSGQMTNGETAVPVTSASKVQPPLRVAVAGKVKLPIRHTSVQSSEPYAPIAKSGEQEQVPEIELFVGESRVFPAPGVARIAVGSGQIITANALDDKDVIVFGNGTGTSTLFVWNQDGRYQRIKVNVLANDMSRYIREVAAFLSTIPQAKATVVGDKVIVKGDELSDADREKVAELAKRYPQIVNFTSPIGWEQMVMMDVKVVEFPRTELRELGLKWSAVGGAAIGSIWAPAGRGDQTGRTDNGRRDRSSDYDDGHRHHPVWDW